MLSLLGKQSYNKDTGNNKLQIMDPNNWSSAIKHPDEEDSNQIKLQDRVSSLQQAKNGTQSYTTISEGTKKL
jgi:hypothetical protein